MSQKALNLLQLVTTVLILVTCALVANKALASEKPRGAALPGLEAFDTAVQAIIDKWEIPGASLSIALKGRLILEHGYGFADTSAQTVVTPDSLFRLGSLSKTITAVAVLQLVEHKQLRLDQKVVPILGELAPMAIEIRDPRVNDITVRELLQHRGGFDRDKSGDPIMMPKIAEVVKRQGSATCPAVLKDALEQQLDFTPGSKFAYSNVGYCILGKIVEIISKEDFSAYVEEHIFGPAGLTKIRLGHTLETAEGEVHYYDYPGAPLALPTPGYGDAPSPRPYGAGPLEAMAALGAWIAPPVEYLRFLLALDGKGKQPLLTISSIREMHAKGLARNDSGANYYGMGIFVHPFANGDEVWWHNGNQPGFFAFYAYHPDGFAFVVAFNSRPQNLDAFFHDLDDRLWAAKRRVSHWPDGDLFVN